MALTPGTRVGPYEILAPIGAGGMGEVYRARDTKLDREVAIKALPDEFAIRRREGRSIRARGEAPCRTEPPRHRNRSRPRGVERAQVSGDGARAGRDARGEDFSRAAAHRRVPRNLPPDRRSSGSGAREGNHPPRPEARERHRSPKMEESRSSTSDWRRRSPTRRRLPTCRSLRR